MFGKSLKLIPLLVLGLLGSGCEILEAVRGSNHSNDEEILARAGAVRLTPDQVRQRIIGKTEEWIHGGAYYLQDGGLEVKWRKTMYKATWKVSSDGTLCYQLPKWERRCHFYMDKAGKVYMLDEGKNIGVRATYKGNRLRELGRIMPVHDRSK